MEAAIKKKKSTALSKGKLKKTIKNVLCRPDPTIWPIIPEEKESILRAALSKYKAEIPVFIKPHWKELKLIPKADRPKQPKLPKQEGLIFGATQCCEGIKNKECSAVFIESEVNPRLIVQPILEACTANNIPVVCIKNLRQLSLTNFGIKTICLGVKKNHLKDLTDKINEFAKSVKHASYLKETVDDQVVTKTALQISNIVQTSENDSRVTNLLLFRKSKQNRVFIPISDSCCKEVKKQFIGQDFIEFSGHVNKPDQSNSNLKNMMLKRITNNPNRVKAGKKKKN